MCKSIVVREDPPKLRGVFHGVAFALTMVLSAFFTALFIRRGFNPGIMIYLLSQLLQYGVSTCYHMFNWPLRTKILLRHLDYICIFILISGIQTSVMMNIIGTTKSPFVFIFIKLSWTISIIGIAKIIILQKMHTILDLVIYCLHGLIIAPFYGLIKTASLLDQALILAGGLFYLLGGLVYGLERPNPFPRIIGYHEVFHAFTLAANVCFAISITRKYVHSLLIHGE